MEGNWTGTLQRLTDTCSMYIPTLLRVTTAGCVCVCVCVQVLYLEQLLTTGGGWQDQCGGLYGGAKISNSDIGLPVKINTQQIGIYSTPHSVHYIVFFNLQLLLLGS